VGSRRRGQRAELAGEVADLLFVAAAIGLPRLLRMAELFLLGVEDQFALDEGGGLRLDLGLAGGGPVAKAGAKLRQFAVLRGDPLAQLDKLFAPRLEASLFQAILLGKFEPELRN